MRKTSVSFKMSNLFFKFINYKRPFKNDKTFRRYLRKKRKENNKRYSPLFPVLKRLDCERFQVGIMDYFIINKEGTRKVLFIPGGSYIDNPTEIHWLFVEKMVKECNANVYMPIYPKLPTYSINEAIPPLKELYQKLGNNVILVADSAGAGLGLALSFLFGGKAFKKTILVSPWVDISLNNEELVEVEKVDPILSIKGLKMLGQLWDKEKASELTSPILGDLSVLDNLYIFGGTHELFYPDLRKFVNEFPSTKNVHYYEYPNMNHGFVLHPIKEAKEPMKKLLRILCEE